MLFKSPDFWWHKSWFAKVLYPLSLLYYLVFSLKKMLARPYEARVPVICVGNIIVGGAGKTPVAIALAKILKTKGINVAFVSRGYGGREKGPLKVEPAKHNYMAVGDEAMLLARYGQVYIAKNRYQAVQAAQNDGAEVIIMDDGLQNFTVHKDYKILVLDGGTGLGNGYLLPAGPLREKFADLQSEIDLVVILGEDKVGIRTWLPNNIQVVTARVKADPGATLPNHKLVAFAGIGLPEKFWEIIRGMGGHIIATKIFPDHYQYKDKDIRMLEDLAYRHDAALITTEKDIVRINKAGEVAVLPVMVAWDDPELVKQILCNIYDKRNKILAGSSSN